MRIRTEKDVEELADQIQIELGVDLRQYQSDEMVDHLIATLDFYSDFVRSFHRPMLVCLALYLLGYLGLDLTGGEYLIYGVIGFWLYLVIGVVSSLLVVIWKMKQNLWNAISFSIELMAKAISDLEIIQDQINPENKRAIIRLLFQGIMHLITIPIFARLLAEQIPFIGSWLSKLFLFLLRRLTDRLALVDYDVEVEIRRSDDKSATIQELLQVLPIVSELMGKFLRLTATIAQLPLLFGGLVAIFLLYVLIMVLG